MSAAVLSLRGYQEQQAGSEFRRQVHRQVDQFLDRLEAGMDSSPEERPSLFQLSETVRQERGALTGGLLQAYVSKTYGSYLMQQQAQCPGCSRWLSARPARPRTVETLVGPLTLERPYFYCEGCRQGFYPLDQALGLSAHRKQYDIQQAASALAVEMPYREAAAWLSQWTDASISDEALHGMVQQVGGSLGLLDMCPTPVQVQECIAAVAAGKKWKPIMVVAIDGATVPTRPEKAKGGRPGRKKVRARRAHWTGEYREAKGFRVFLLDEDRIVHLISWHQIQTEEELAAALQQLQDAGLIPEDQVRLCVVADGAPWIWKRVEQLFPSARQILDFYHCTSYLHAVAQTQYGDDGPHAREWLEATMARLFDNEGAGVIWGLQRMKPVSLEAEAAIEKTLSYLAPRLEQIAYGSHRKGGYPLGSGAIESAHRFICQVRLKRSGAWWYQENSNLLLALRCAKYNGTWNRVFQRYRQTTPSNPTTTNC